MKLTEKDRKKLQATRDKLTPQMADYRESALGVEWVPYVMNLAGSSRNLDACSTDEWGLRKSVGRDMKPDSLASLLEMDEDKIGIMIGGSTAFGVGVSNDRCTIPSYLNNITDIRWANFGGRGFNSTQELILFMLHAPSKIRSVIVFSGVNNLVLALLSKKCSPVYNSLFYKDETALEHKIKYLMGLDTIKDKTVRNLASLLGLASSMAIETENSTLLEDENYQNILQCFRRDMGLLKMLAVGKGASIHFVLQPLASWLDKKLSQEEEILFDLLNCLSQDWDFLQARICDYKEVYFDDMKKICEELAVPYFNMNTTPEFLRDEWLFVDRVHLTDAGSSLSAKIIKREFNL